MGITNIQDKASVLIEPVLIGGGTDGASVNVSEQNGMNDGKNTASMSLDVLGMVVCTSFRACM